MTEGTRAGKRARKLRGTWLLGSLWLVLAGLAWLACATGVCAQASPKVADALVSKAQNSGSVRVIVRLNTSFQPEGRLSGGTAIKNQRERISGIQNQLHQDMASHNVRGIKKFRYIPFTAMEVSPGALQTLAADSRVLSIEEDKPVRLALYDSVPLIKADQAWSAGYTGNGWAVAILDTGVDKTHSFIGSDKVIAEACYSTTSVINFSTTVCPNNADSQTGSGAGVNCSTSIGGCAHGTHVAGIAAGKNGLYNGKTYNGVAKDAYIIAVQVFSKFTRSSDCDGSAPCIRSWSSDQISGMEYVYSLRSTYNIASVNMSLGGSTKYTSASTCDSDSSAVKTAIDNLRSVGIATVIASGNSSWTDGISSPGCISTAVSVGASDKSDKEASFSNYSPTLLALFAPGVAITSSVPNNGWESWNGTSMATPHVTGAWAILKQKSSSASVATILNYFQTTGATVTLKSGDAAGGSVKRIDVLAALNAMGAAPIAPGNLTMTGSTTSTVSLNWSDNSFDETGFQIERKTGASGIYSQVGTTGGSIATYTDSTGLVDGTVYYYRVRANNVSLESAYSNEASATTLLAAPSALSASAASSSQINLSWTDNSSNESGFYIERASASGGPYTQIGTADASATSYQDKSLAADTTYYYQVRAYNSNTNSTYSNEAFAKTSANMAVAGGGGGGGGGCFIATAAFGTPMEKHVSILREFRDRCLLTTSPGKAFVKLYYEVSPPIAAKIAQSEGLRFITRCGLMPLVGTAYLMVTYGVAAALMLALSLILMTGILIWVIRKKVLTAD